MRICFNIYETVGTASKWVGARVINIEEEVDINEEVIRRVLILDGCSVDINTRREAGKDVYIIVLFDEDSSNDIWRGIYKLGDRVFIDSLSEKIRECLV